jgi:neurotransmitter:Na+ symporter, NSS family
MDSSTIVTPKARDIFTSKLGVIFATLGSAVGLGNIWKFPSLTGMNGGAAFLILYLASTLLVGVPAMISELTIGRKARANAVDAMVKETPDKKKPWWLVAAAGVLSAFLIMAFYTEVAAWVFAYIFKAIGGGILSTDPAVTSKAFTDLITNPLQSLVWQWVVLAMITVIIIKGVSKGIERTTSRLMPIMFCILIAICIRSLTLPGASQGLVFLFKPDFSKITASVVLTAVGLSFFKLSTGMGTMITYGSYFREDQNIAGTAVRVALADMLVSLLAGIAIFPAVFAFGFQPDAGPSLLFITIPAVFASMPFGSIFMVLFFVLAAIAATGAMLSLLEVPVAFLEERFKLSRPQATIGVSVLLALIGSTAALSNSVLADATILGKTFFDLYDFISSNLLLPMGGLFITIFVGWVWGFGKVQETLSNKGKLSNEPINKAIFFVIRFITPVLLFVVLLGGLNLIKF